MTLEDFRKLKTGEYVKLLDNIYNITYVPSNGIHASYWDCENKFAAFRLYDSKCLQGNLLIVIDSSNLPNPNLSFGLPDITIPTEKEVLEIQLKEAEEQVQKETARVDSIKAKLEELSKPKLKVGGLYRFKFSERCLIGVLRSIEADTYTFVSSGFNNYSYSSKFPKSIENAEFKEITNPKYSHIGPTILEFMKLNPENFK